MSKLFEIKRDDASGEEYLETWLSGSLLLDHPLLNKGSAFSERERREFDLLGLLPAGVSTPERQLERIYGNYRTKTSNIERYIFLQSLQDRNETAFYRLLSEHLVEMMPIVYTPVVGEACQAYSRIYHRPRGLYVAYPHKESIDTILDNVVETGIEVIVVTDGERILGLGDLGVGGMGIPIGKLSLYTVCAGIHPANTLPIILDVGTNNQALLDDPLYLGWRQRRVRGQDYDDFVAAFIAAVNRRFPNVLLQWEDFAKHNAARLLDQYRDRICTFNDDIQGTGAVTLAAAMAATASIGSKLGDQRVVLFGAGSAAAGICSQLVTAMMSEGSPESAAKASIWMVDSKGLVHSRRRDLDAFKQAYSQPSDRLADWSLAAGSEPTLLDVVRNARPTLLIGIAAQPNAFDEQIVREMARHAPRPMIFPLSNPTSKCEAQPTDLVAWTGGRALIATGSPFADVDYQGRRYPIAQCNNAYIFPGVGLGVIAGKVRRITDALFVAAARSLSELSPARRDPDGALLPALEGVRAVSRHVALAVAREAQRAGLADPMSDAELEKCVDQKMWSPRFLPYRRVKQI